MDFLCIEELALMIDKDRQWMNYLENGRGNPTIKTLFLIATELDISIKDIVDFE